MGECLLIGKGFRGVAPDDGSGDHSNLSNKKFYREFISSNIPWTVPKGVYKNQINVRIFGGGGGGAVYQQVSHSNPNRIVHNFNLGGGGGYMNNASLSLKAGTIININIGRGGKENRNGGPSSFGNYLIANGGGSAKCIGKNAIGGSGGSGGFGVTKGGDAAQFGGGGSNAGLMYGLDYAWSSDFDLMEDISLFGGGNGGIWGGGGGSNAGSGGDGGTYGGGGGAMATSYTIGHKFNLTYPTAAVANEYKRIGITNVHGGNGGKYGGGGSIKCGLIAETINKYGRGGEYGGNGSSFYVTATGNNVPTGITGSNCDTAINKFIDSCGKNVYKMINFVTNCYVPAEDGVNTSGLANAPKIWYDPYSTSSTKESYVRGSGKTLESNRSYSVSYGTIRFSNFMGGGGGYGGDGSASSSMYLDMRIIDNELCITTIGGTGGNASGGGGYGGSVSLDKSGGGGYFGNGGYVGGGGYGRLISTSENANNGGGGGWYGCGFIGGGGFGNGAYENKAAGYAGGGCGNAYPGGNGICILEYWADPQ